MQPLFITNKNVVFKGIEFYCCNSLINSSLPYFKNSEFDRIIPPEVKDDEFYEAIQTLARETDIKTVLEIGSSSGAGSTEAFVKGLRHNPNHPTLFCMEISKPRFLALQKAYDREDFVKCY